MDCPSPADSAVMSSKRWPTKKLFRPGIRKPLRRTEKSVRLLSAIVHLFTPAKELIINLYAGSLTTVIAALGSARTSKIFGKHELGFGAAVSRLIGLTDSLEHRATQSHIAYAIQ